MSLLDRLPMSDCEIITGGGELVAKTRAAILPENIIVTDVKIPINVGDEIRRRLPSGQDEVFEVIDPTFFAALRGVPQHYQVKYKRKGSFNHGEGGNFTVHVSGNNARLNLGSRDQSTNIVVEGDVFGSLTTALKTKVSDEAQLAPLLAAIEEMRAQQKKPGFAVAFQKFMSICGDCIEVVTPFLPALTKFIMP